MLKGSLMVWQVIGGRTGLWTVFCLTSEIAMAVLLRVILKKHQGCCHLNQALAPWGHGLCIPFTSPPSQHRGTVPCIGKGSEILSPICRCDRCKSIFTVASCMLWLVLFISYDCSILILHNPFLRKPLIVCRCYLCIFSVHTVFEPHKSRNGSGR